jgi:Conserved TM helix
METKLLEAFTALGSSIASAIPRIAIGILLIILGLVVAKLIEVTLRTMFTRIRFDSLMERAGVTKALRRIGLRQPLSLLLPKLIYFLIIFLLAKTASDAFGLIAISNALGAFFSYLPNILAALLLLILGTTVGQFTGQMVTQAAENSKLDSAPALGRLVSALIIFLVAGFYTRRLLSVGKSLTIAGQSGVLTAIGPTHAVLFNEGREIFVANAKFLEQTSTQNVNPPQQ